MAAPVFADATGAPIIGAVGFPMMDVVVPEATGPPEPTYAAVGTLPPGVSFATDTRTISFDRSLTEVGSGTITIRATNVDGTADWTVDYEFVTIGMKASASASVQAIPAGDSVDLTGDAYGDLLVIGQAGPDPENLYAITQVAGAWRAIYVGSITNANLRNPRGLTTRDGNLFVIDWWGEDIHRITDIATGAATELGSETSSSLVAPEGAAFLGNTFWSIDGADDALWTWADVVNSPNSGNQRGTLSISGTGRGLTVRNDLLAVLFESGSTWTFAQIDNPVTGSVTQLASLTRPTGVTGNPRAVQEYRGGLFVFTDDLELVELTGIGGTPALEERADFDGLELGPDDGTNGPGGMTQFPVPASYAWSSDSGGTFGNAAAKDTTWDSTGVTAGTIATLTLRVVDGGGNNFDRSVRVQVGGSAPSFADDTGDLINVHVGDTIPSVVVPAATGTAPTYAVVGALPAGVAFDPATRTLSFDGNAIVIGTGTIRIRATNPAGSDDWTVAYLFTAAQVAPSFADDTGDPITAEVGSTIADVTVPVAAGNPSPSYAVVGALPTGVTFSGRVLSFDGDAIQVGSGTITIRATNGAGSADWTVAYTFTAAPVPLSLSGSLAGAGGSLAGALVVEKTPLSLSGSLAGAGGSLAGSLVRGDVALSVSGALSGAGGILAGGLTLGTVGAVPLLLSGSLAGAGGSLAGRFVLAAKPALEISGALTGSGGMLAGELADNRLAVSGALVGSGGLLAGMLGGAFAPLSEPRQAAARAAAGGGLLVSWQPPAGDGGAPVYRYEITADGGETWWATADATPEWTLEGVPPGAYRLRVRARTASGPGPWSVGVEVDLPVPSRVESDPALYIYQWQNAPRLKAIATIALDVLREEIDRPRLYLAGQMTIEKAEGVWLDGIGVRLGIPRPSTTRVATDPRFGFDLAGSGFDQGPFRGDPSNDAVSPIGDELYRRILRARSIALLSDGTLDAFTRAVRAVDPGAGVTDRLDMRIRVLTGMVWQVELAESLGALGRPAGVRVEIEARGRFGFDLAGSGFDQGPFAPA